MSDSSAYRFDDNYGTWEVAIDTFDYPDQQTPSYKPSKSFTEHLALNPLRLMTHERMLRAGVSGAEPDGSTHPDSRPFCMVSPSFVSSYATVGVGISHHKIYGTMLEGELSVLTSPEYVRVNKVNILNPALADCTPSTTVTPIEVMLFNMPPTDSLTIQRSLSLVARSRSSEVLLGDLNAGQEKVRG